jgi:hypothetical protein
MTDLAAHDLGIAGVVDPSATATDADHARAELAAFKANTDLVKQHLNGSQATREQLDKLYARIHAPPPGSISFGAASLEQQRNQVADDLAETGPGLSEAHVREIREGTPNSPEIYRQAVAMKAALLRDPKFTESLMRNEYEPRRKMLLLNVILSNPISLKK